MTWWSRIAAGRTKLEPDGKGAGQFVRHLTAMQRNLHSEDVRLAVHDFLHRSGDLVSWYEAIVAPFDTAFVFDGHSPKLKAGWLGSWRSTTSRIDADALVTLKIARDTTADDTDALESLCEWGFHVACTDHGLEKVLSRGIADIHVHFEASDPMQLLWWRLASGRVEASELRHYSAEAFSRIDEDVSDSRKRLEELSHLSQLPLVRANLVDRLVLEQHVPGPRLDAAAILTEERRLLLGCWRALLRDPEWAGLSDFDRYLYGKNLFVYRHQQSAGQGAGLSRFREFLDRGETLGERRSKKTKVSVRRQRQDRMLALATEPKNLRHLELRIAPPADVAGWYRFFRLWESRLADPDRIRPDVEIRFVVHFIREAKDENTSGLAMHHAKLRSGLDRKTAVFQLFRHKCPFLAKHVVGIDVANMERGCPPELFAPYLQRLRGEKKFAGHIDHPSLAYWKRLADRGLDRPPVSLRPLGLTYHAGEDFHHPADGLRALSGLVTHLLRPGDRIGHGLAVGWDIDRFSDSRGLVGMPAGVLLDNLAWLRHEGGILDMWKGRLQLEGDAAIRALSSRIYGSPVAFETLESALSARFDLPEIHVEATAPAAVRLVSMEATDDVVRRNRATFTGPDDCRILEHSTGILRSLQGVIARQVRDSGIVVEANPSSNLATQSVTNLVDHPFFRYMTELSGQGVVCINTDDPGVFGTTLEIEYALMFEAMLERGMDRGSALETLERSRRLNLDFAF